MTLDQFIGFTLYVWMPVIVGGYYFIKWLGTPDPEPPPYEPPFETRFEHTHVVAGSGHGKTQMLQAQLMSDIRGVIKGEQTVIVIDSQGDLIKNILTLKAIEEVGDRLIYINPSDFAVPPALNLFDFGLERNKEVKPDKREKILNGAVELYEYLFGALIGAELTQKQGVIFRYLARLMMVVPGATIETLMTFMEKPETVTSHFTKLDPTTADFFRKQFFLPIYANTRQQILVRLWGIRSNSILDRMFTHPKNKVDLYNVMNSGSLILISTSKELLKQDGCEVFGRFFIALIAQAAQERAEIGNIQKRLPTFLYIDEAQDYFDEKIGVLLTQGRKYRLGLILAHQFLDQFDPKLRQAVMTNTAIKYVGGVSAKDANTFAREMRCQPEFLQEITKEANATNFALFVKNQTSTPIIRRFPFGRMERQPKTTMQSLTDILNRNRERVGDMQAAIAKALAERQQAEVPMQPRRQEAGGWQQAELPRPPREGTVDEGLASPDLL